MLWASVASAALEVTFEFIYKKGPPTVDAEMQAHMQHGIRNEVSDY